MSRDITTCVGHVGAVQLANSVVAEAGPHTNSLCARFVPEKTQRKLQTQPLTAVAIFRDTHDLFFLGLFLATDIVFKFEAKDNRAKFGKKSSNAGDSLQAHFVRMRIETRKGTRGHGVAPRNGRGFDRRDRRPES